MQLYVSSRKLFYVATAFPKGQNLLIVSISILRTTNKCSCSRGELSDEILKVALIMSRIISDTRSLQMKTKESILILLNDLQFFFHFMIKF